MNVQKVAASQRKQLSEVRSLVQGFFNDKDKTELWIGAPNPLLGGISPIELIRLGRGAKLIKNIKTMLNENLR